MTLKELTKRLLAEIHPDEIRWLQSFELWFARMEAGYSVGDPLARDCYHFAKALLNEYDLVKKA